MKISIIAACYNISDYIDRFFSSIVNQTIGFEKSIYVICVDDGSVDETKLKILQWQKKFPNNIDYVYQHNSGQAAARNTGILRCPDTEWVTFADPDDSFSSNFFEEMIDRTREKNICIVCSRTIYFDEYKNKYLDTHPLRYRFYGLHKEKVCKLNKRIIPASNSSIFMFDIIKRHKILFNEKVKPTFEDTLFVLNYLHYCGNLYVYFSARAKYFYTKRIANNSSIDLSKNNPKRYYDQLLYGNLTALSKYINDGEYVKITVLYDLLWLLKYIVDRDDRLSFLSEEQVKIFNKLLQKIFSYYSINDIEKFDIIQIPILLKLGICFRFLNGANRATTAIIEDYDYYKNEIKIHFYSPASANGYCLISNGFLYEPINFKTVKHRLCRSLFLLETVAWFAIPRATSFSIFVNDKQATLLWQNKGYFSLRYSDLIKRIGQHRDGGWVFIDRDKCADDNAEHFYRWVWKNTKQKSIYFILKQDSPDWNRLSLEGFNLVEYGSLRHKQLLTNAELIISSQIDSYVYKVDGKSYLDGNRLIFLQHGVIKDDLSSWINSKPKISLMLTSTIAEYNSIVGGDSLYLLTKREVKLFGLPRFETLNCLSHLKSSHKIILVMPTWRKRLVENGIGSEILADRFLVSNFYREWLSVLTSEAMINFVNLGYKIFFRLHPCLEVLKDSIKFPSYVDLINHQSGVLIQELFVKSEFLVTDYSSVAFDFASMGKMVFYYQFDRDSFFNNHTYTKGYFNYESDGFGPVAYTLPQLQKFFAKYLYEKDALVSIYKDRLHGHIFCKNSCAKLYDELSKSLIFDPNPEIKPSKKVNYFEKKGRIADIDYFFRPYQSKGNIYLNIESEFFRYLCTERMFNKYKTNRIAFFTDSKSKALNTYICVLFFFEQLFSKIIGVIRRK